MAGAQPSLLDALAPSHLDPILETLVDANECLKPRSVMIVGGVAIRYAAGAAGKEFPGSDSFNDLDVATDSLDAVLPLKREGKFRLAHRHLPDGRGRHYAAVIHAPSGVKTDIYTAYRDEPDPLWVPLGIGNIHVAVRDSAAQFVASVEWLTNRVEGSVGFGSHDKAVVAVDLLAEIVYRAEVERLWRAIFPQAPMGAFEMHEMAVAEAIAQGESEKSSRSHKLGLLASCGKCDRDPSYPLISGIRAAAIMKGPRWVRRLGIL